MLYLFGCWTVCTVSRKKNLIRSELRFGTQKPVRLQHLYAITTIFELAGPWNPRIFASKLSASSQLGG